MKELNPVPIVTHTGKRGKIAEGDSVKVIAEGIVKIHELAAASGFFGMVTDIKDKTNGTTGKRAGVAGDEISLTIEQAQYETKLIDAGADYTVGTDVYWDGTKLVETATDLYVGKVTRTKAPGGAIWILLAPQQAAATGGGN
ncbi:hypothetical protein A0U40_17880 [[Bacillus] sp. KCTC 13219]|nr:hypothetical protein A0U40_17880 [[Bacillus] sp. KCTC 13219]